MFDQNYYDDLRQKTIEKSLKEEEDCDFDTKEEAMIAYNNNVIPYISEVLKDLNLKPNEGYFKHLNDADKLLEIVQDKMFGAGNNRDGFMLRAVRENFYKHIEESIDGRLDESFINIDWDRDGDLLRVKTETFLDNASEIEMVDYYFFYLMECLNIVGSMSEVKYEEGEDKTAHILEIVVMLINMQMHAKQLGEV